MKLVPYGWSTPARRSAASLVLLALLPACQPSSLSELPPPIPQVARARIHLHVDVLTKIDPRTRGACVDDIIATFRSHGFVLDPEGPRVDMEVTLLHDPEAFPVLENLSSLSPSVTIPVQRQPALSAEITAKVQTGPDQHKVLRAAGSAQQVPCAAAAERLWSGVGEALR